MNNRKKVAFIITNLGMGGAENMLVEQVKFLDKKRFEPCIITLRQHPKMNVVHKVPQDVNLVEFNFTSVFDIISLYKLWVFLRRERIYAVFTSLFNANLIGRTAAILARIPVVLSSEVNVYVDKSKWQIVADKILARFTKKIVVSSNDVLNFTSKQENLPREKFELNFNAVPLILGDIKHKRNEILSKYDLSENLTYIVTAGSLTPQKGQSFFIDAVYQMKQDGVKDFKVLIFGKGPLKEDLLAQIQKLGLEEEIKLMGIIPAEDIMAISDIFTLPSLWEGLSIALLQAMDARCPIVATRVSGTNEALENEVSALLVSPGESSELAEAFKRLLNDGDLRGKLSRVAREQVKKFSIEENVKVIENLILPS